MHLLYLYRRTRDEESLSLRGAAAGIGGGTTSISKSAADINLIAKRAHPLDLPVLIKINDFDQTRTMDGFRPFLSGDHLRRATDVRGCQVESVHGAQPVFFRLCARDLIDTFEIERPYSIAKKSFVECCFHSSLVKSSFGRDFEIEE